MVTQVIKGDDVRDGFCSISQEIFDVSSPNSYTDAPGQNEDQFEPGDLDLIFKVNRGHLRQQHLRWFPLNISRNIRPILTKFGTQKHQGKEKTKFELGDLDPNFNVTDSIQYDGIRKMVSAQCLKKYLTHLHQIWYTGAPVQDEDQV